MAKLVSKSGTKSVILDFFNLKLGKMENPSMMAVLFVKVVGNEC